MNKQYIVRLTREERQELLSMVRVGKAAAYKLLWARILLKVHQAEEGPGLSDEKTDEALETDPTPKHASWLNIAEIMIGIMNQQCLSGRIGDTTSVRDQVAAWEADGNAHAKPVHWQFTTENARAKLKRLYPTL